MAKEAVFNFQEKYTNWDNKKEILKSFNKEKFKVETEEYFKDAPETLLNDESFIRCAVKIKGDVLKLCPQNQLMYQATLNQLTNCFRNVF